MKRFFAAIASILLFAGCDRYTNYDYRMDSDWVYVNESSYNLKLISNSEEYDRDETFELPIGASHTVELRQFSTTTNLKASDYQSPYYHFEVAIKIDGQKFVLDSDCAFVNAANYRSEQLGTNYYKFTYIFTDEIVEHITEVSKVQ